MAAIISLGFHACSQKSATPACKKVLVAYFSATGTTAAEAKLVAQAANATLFEITPEQPYSDADLDWHNKLSRSSVEMQDPTSRPPIKATLADADQYDVVFLGFPIWWDLAPRAVNTFLDIYGFKGKTIIPFATSGGSTITNSVNELRKEYQEINWSDGRLLNGDNIQQVTRWVDECLK